MCSLWRLFFVVVTIFIVEREREREEKMEGIEMSNLLKDGRVYGLTNSRGSVLFCSVVVVTVEWSNKAKKKNKKKKFKKKNQKRKTKNNI